MAAVGDQRQRGFEAIRQLGGAAIAEGTALQQHQAFTAREGRRSGLIEGLGRLTGLGTIEAAEVEAGPAGIHHFLDQAVDGPVPRGGVITPDQMDRHGSMMAAMAQDHPIFTESIRRIRVALGPTDLELLQQQVLERLITSFEDLGVKKIVNLNKNIEKIFIKNLAKI